MNRYKLRRALRHAHQINGGRYYASRPQINVQDALSAALDGGGDDYTQWCTLANGRRIGHAGSIARWHWPEYKRALRGKRLA